MKPDYTITVRNETGGDRTYFVYQSPPTVTSGITPTLCTNVYLQGAPISGAPISATAKSIFRLFKSTYAICGATIDTESETDFGVKSIDSKPCDLASLNNPGTLCFMTAIGSGQGQGAKFDSARTKQLREPEGSFGITTDGDFVKGHLYVGLGAPTLPDASDMFTLDDVVPVTTLLAEPSNLYTIAPVSTYFIATGNPGAGTVVNPQDINSVRVDFSSDTFTNATVVQDTNNRYSVSFR
ncbi:hypothetical protein LTR66_002543 [Elasticomyces elasticus]|nr:hypothetical protein LTR66_002543 [Elasticomyces elasticus]